SGSMARNRTRAPCQTEFVILLSRSIIVQRIWIIWLNEYVHICACRRFVAQIPDYTACAVQLNAPGQDMPALSPVRCGVFAAMPEYRVLSQGGCKQCGRFSMVHSGALPPLLSARGIHSCRIISDSSRGSVARRIVNHSILSRSCSIRRLRCCGG